MNEQNLTHLAVPACQNVRPHVHRSGAIFVLLLLASTASGATADFRATYGSSRFSGDLSEEAAAQSYTLGVRKRSGGNGLWFSPGFDVVRLAARHTGSDFPFPPGADLEILSFLALGSACWQGEATWFVCGGLGVGNVNVNAAGFRQDYGSWHYELSAGWSVAEAWKLHVLSKYIGKVEQRIAGKNSDFAFTCLGLGVSSTAF